jgi:hypothetical protein
VFQLKPISPVTVPIETRYLILKAIMQSMGIVEFEIGFIAEHSLILFLTHILKCSNPLWLAQFQAPAFAYFPCSEGLHVKCRLLPEDVFTSPAIGDISAMSHERFCLRI